MKGNYSSIDGVFLMSDKNNTQSVIFNVHSWSEIIKAILVKYANKSEVESSEIFHESIIIKNFNVTSYNDVIFYSHELEYHWAMLMAHGEQYWLKGISSDEPDGYFEWETQYRKDHNLAEESFEFSE